MEKQKIKLCIITGLLLLPAAAAAQVNCIIDKPVFLKTITLAGANISVAADVPVGAVIYSGVITNAGDPSGSSAMTCKYGSTDKFLFNSYTQLTGGITDVNSGITPTNLPGIGLKISNALSGDKTPLSNSQKKLLISLSYPETNGPCDQNKGSCGMAANSSFTFQLVKTGNITPGTITGATFPQIATTAESPTAGAAVATGNIALTSFAGALSISTPTCNASSSPTVQLGTHEIRDMAENNNSPWIDASITLTGCTRFFTGMPGTNSTTWRYPDTNATAPVYKNNQLEMTITPMTQTRPGANGAFVIDNMPGAASGVDIQMAKGTPTTNIPMDLNMPHYFTIPTDNGSTLRVELVARYLRNNDPLSPGIANGKVVYLINYK